MKIHEVITDESWIQGWEEKGDKCCAAGWIRRVYPDDRDYSRCYAKLYDVVGQPVRGWNDNIHRTFPEVLAAFKKADL